jgi:CspA family cold shock protein
MKKGTVKFFNESKGFGFINDLDTGEDVFVHASGLIDEIRDGDVVTFEVKPGKKGMNAVNVRVVNE